MKIYYYLLNGRPVSLSTSYIEGIHTHEAEITAESLTTFGLEEEFKKFIKTLKDN